MVVYTRTIMLALRNVDYIGSPDFLPPDITNTTDPATAQLISKLIFAESKWIRTSTILLASFNIIAAAATAASIIYDCYWASKRCNPKFKASKFCISSIHPAELYPLIISIGIVIQGIIFTSVQSTGLMSVTIDGCGTIAQVIWPAIFIVPYIQVVLGIECAFRALQNLPFQARGKYNVSKCGAIVFVMLIATWIPSFLVPAPDICLASLLGFITRYGVPGIIIFSSAAGLMFISALTIFLKLSTANFVDQHQRIAASRIVHYMAVGFVSLALILPYFGSLASTEGNKKLGMLATVVLNISGLIHGLLHLILRANTSTTSIGPKIGGSWDGGKHEIRIFGPNELRNYRPIEDPVFSSLSLSTATRESQFSELSRKAGSSDLEKEEINMEKLPSHVYGSPQHTEVETSEIPATTMQNPFPFPSAQEAPPPIPFNQFAQQVSIYDITDLAPPKPSFARNSRHVRVSSDSSTATVQIGLRLSLAPLQAFAKNEEAFSLPSTTYDARPPAAPASPASPAPLSSPYSLQPKTYSGFQRAVLPPIPLHVETNVSTGQSSPMLSSPNDKKPEKPESPHLKENLDTLEQPISLLPSKPSDTKKPRLSGIKLSPSVYRPQKKSSATSRKGSVHEPSKSPTEKFKGPDSPSNSTNPGERADWI
ncbi:Bgt-2720 [Blumeria graminis f. sp. tritici]|uniref:Bgt-2720 n=2 Tax=Blumeria graminis f. sp. tritici TaxID=62690 RepID=A0A061HIM4_BLUGR|nr:hypothetical protein BGT96224_2720 [Blumeria graminis f. sp. tritici 96224]VDB85943.1 Bgt-2720 [Blumeria graminis f. sp. tritici]